MSRIPRALLAGAALVLGAALIAVSVAHGGASTSRGGTLRVGGYWRSIDPVDFAPTLTVYNLTTLPLVAYPDRTGDLRLLPEGAAAMPRVSADGRTYTFTIRRGLRFSDGTPVTAANYVAAFRRLFDRNLDSYGAGVFDDVVGAKTVMSGQPPSGVKANGDTLVIRLRGQRPDLLARLALGWISATPVDLPAVPAKAPLPSAAPYYVQEFVPRGPALVVRNPYWGRDLIPWRPANVDRVERTGPVPTAEAVALVERGEIDITAPAPEQVPALMAKYGLGSRLVRQITGNVDSIEFNHDSPLFRNNPRLRQAINYALDRPELVRQRGPLAGIRTDQMIPPGWPGYHDWDLYPLKAPNLRKARALANGNLRTGTAILWTTPEGSGASRGTERLAQVVKYDLAQIGLKVEIRVLDHDPLIEKASQAGAEWDMLALGTNWIPDFADPYGIINMQLDSARIHYGEGLNMTNLDRFRDDLFDRRMRAAARLAGTARYSAYALLERDLMRDAAPIAPYMAETSVSFLSKNTGCFTSNPMGIDYTAFCKR